MNFGGIIYGWYKKNKRDLPWRRTNDPYLVWISEIILQQTRVSQGIEYYYRFAEAFPDVTSLAAAKEEQVLKLWQGLGYYSRARNMHRAAMELVDAHEAKMPATFEGLLAMKGVGTYTASAVASICFGEVKAVVDGNVSRVIARLYGVEEPVNSTAGKRIIETLAAQLMIDRQGSGDGVKNSRSVSPGSHNQAMMEFGALQCVPVSPDCLTCPLSGQCNAGLSGRVANIPIKIPKRKPVDRWMYFYVFTSDDQTILTRRVEQGIWRSLYHFPVIESSKAHPEEDFCDELYNRVLHQLNGHLSVTAGQGLPHHTTATIISAPIHHQLTHITIHARFIHIELATLPSQLPENFIRIAMSNVEQYPVPRLMERYMEVAKF